MPLVSGGVDHIQPECLSLVSGALSWEYAARSRYFEKCERVPEAMLDKDYVTSD
jgi:hypothetical protein